MTLGPLMIDLLGKELLPEEREMLQHPLVGGVILFTRNFESREQIKKLIDDVRAVRAPALLIAVDYEGGRVQRFRNDFTLIPPMRALGKLYDQHADQALQLARQCGWLLASELRSVHIDLNFGPVVDLDYGASSVIGDRSFHHDARVVSALAIAIMHGMRDAGMHAVAKHFPGHGAVVADSHVALPVDHRRYADMDHDLHPYRRLIDNGLAGVMVAHVVYDHVDSVPASFSSRWMRTELREQMNFKGTIFSDDLSMEGASIMGPMPQRVERAIAAGCDMPLICNRRDAVIQTLDHARIAIDPSVQVRLAAVRGGARFESSSLLASSQWQSASEAVKLLHA
jgi:beta-N-acetylhexosaminidase